MLQVITNLASRFWSDDDGSVLATEYLALGTVVALGSVAGLDAVRESGVEEMKEYGRSLRSIRQQYQVPAGRSGLAAKEGSAVTAPPPAFAN